MPAMCSCPLRLGQRRPLALAEYSLLRNFRTCRTRRCANLRSACCNRSLPVIFRQVPATTIHAPREGPEPGELPPAAPSLPTLPTPTVPLPARRRRVGVGPVGLLETL